MSSLGWLISSVLSSIKIKEELCTRLPLECGFCNNTIVGIFALSQTPVDCLTEQLTLSTKKVHNWLVWEAKRAYVVIVSRILQDWQKSSKLSSLSSPIPEYLADFTLQPNTWISLSSQIPWQICQSSGYLADFDFESMKRWITALWDLAHWVRNLVSSILRQYLHFCNIKYLCWIYRNIQISNFLIRSFFSILYFPVDTGT